MAEGSSELLQSDIHCNCYPDPLAGGAKRGRFYCFQFFELSCARHCNSRDAGITPCCCAALAVLWLALAPEKFPLQADTFSRAAGTAGKQKWSLILPSSARVSELTYVTIIGTGYPELDNLQNDVIQFGNYLQGECTRGGFLPIFWFFFAGGCLGWSRAERPSVSWAVV